MQPAVARPWFLRSILWRRRPPKSTSVAPQQRRRCRPFRPLPPDETRRLATLQRLLPYAALSRDYGGPCGWKVLILALLTLVPVYLQVQHCYALAVSWSTPVYVAYHALSVWNLIRFRQLIAPSVQFDLRGAYRILRCMSRVHAVVRPLAWTVALLLAATVGVKMWRSWSPQTETGRLLAAVSMFLGAPLAVDPTVPDAAPAAPLVPGPAAIRRLNIAIIKNSEASYATNIQNALHTSLQEHCDCRVETAVGSAERTDVGDAINKRALADVLAHFGDQGPDYLITIGTRVSEYAHQARPRREGRKHDTTDEGGLIPHLFLAVTDPIESKIVASLANDESRGAIAGITYAPSALELLTHLRRYWPGKRFGFVYSANVPQDNLLADQLRKVGAADCALIEVSKPALTADQLRLADIFCGRYFLCSNLEHFVAASPDTAFVAASQSNAKKGALMSIGPDDREIGRACVREIILPHERLGHALAAMPIHVPPTVASISRACAARLGLDCRVPLGDPSVHQIP